MRCDPSWICVSSWHFEDPVSCLYSTLRAISSTATRSLQHSRATPVDSYSTPSGHPQSLVPHGCCGTRPSSPTPLWSAWANSVGLPSNLSYAPPGVTRTSPVLFFLSSGISGLSSQVSPPTTLLTIVHRSCSRRNMSAPKPRRAGIWLGSNSRPSFVKKCTR